MWNHSLGWDGIWRDGKGWEGMGWEGIEWEMGRDCKGLEGMGRDGKGYVTSYYPDCPGNVLILRS